MSGLCQHCGASSRRACDWHDMTGLPEETAPCEYDGTWDQDPDEAREDRDELSRLEREED